MNNPYEEKPGTVEFYRAFLCDSRKTNQAFAKESSNDDIDHALEIFDRLAKFGSGEMAIKVSLASTNLNHLLSPAGMYVANQLAKIPKQNTVENNSLRRLREIFKKMQADVSKCSVNINGVDYTKEACEAALSKLKLPAGLESWDYSLETAAGSIKGKLVLKVID